MQFIANENDLLSFGGRIAQASVKGLVLYLYGELGVGKTCLVRGFLRGLGYTAAVKSPTYTLIESYIIDNRHIYHLDLYRLNAASGLERIGIRDYYTEDAIFLIEWPERGISGLPPVDLACYLTFFKDNRRLDCRAMSYEGQRIVKEIRLDPSL